MSDAQGIPSVLGIEAVEWLAEGGENVTVRVTGRWRRRRPAWSAQPVLVVEAAGRRFRFPAMPEPPSLSGAGPGMWRISFAVPAALAPELGGRTWLQFGAVAVPLPGAAEPLIDVDPAAQTASAHRDKPAEEPSAAVAAERMGTPSAELEAESARRRAVQAEEAAAELASRVQELEQGLAAAQRDAERLTAVLAEREQTRRIAEQRAHAERALRRDLARQLSARSAQSERVRDVLGDLAAAEERIRMLERELQDARRRGDEAEQAAAAAAVARERAERAARERAEQAEQAARVRADRAEEAARERAERAEQAVSERTESDRIELERELILRRSSDDRRVPSEPQAAPVRVVSAAPVRVVSVPQGPAPSQAPTPPPADAGALTEALRHEIAARAAAEGALRARLIDAEGRLATRVLIERRTAAILTELRGELDGLRAAFAHERQERLDAERRAGELSAEISGGRLRSRQAYEALADLREALENLRAPVAEGARTEPVSAAPGGTSTVQPDRLNDARQRLRQAAELREQANAPPDAPEDAEAVPAGHLLVKERIGRAWLEPVWRGLARSDPGAAGRLLVELLPAQREVYAEPVSYDLVFESRRSCARVTVAEGAPLLVRALEPRPADQVDFQVTGDPAALARLMTAGWWRRRFGRGVARVSGRRGRLAALRALPGVKLDLRALHRLGVRLEPDLMLRLVALMVQPAWTEREQFALRYRGEDQLYLVVRPGVAPEVVAEAPASGVTTTIAGSAEGLMLALAGVPSAAVDISGEEWPVVLLRNWIKRAQSD